MPTYAENLVSRPSHARTGARTVPRGDAGGARADGVAVPRLDVIQAMFDQSPRVLSLAATGQALNRRSADAVVQRVVTLRGVPVTELDTLASYEAYERLTFDERAAVDRQFQQLQESGDLDAGSEDELVALLQALALSPTELDQSGIDNDAEQNLFPGLEQNLAVTNNNNNNNDNNSSSSSSFDPDNNSNLAEKKEEELDAQELPKNVLYRQLGAELANDAPSEFRIASFDDTQPLTLYRFISSEELDELRETIGTEGKPVFKHREDRKGGEKFFAVNKRYVWSGWKEKGKRAKQHPEMLKVVLRPGVRTAFLHNPDTAGVSESAKGAHLELKGLKSVREGQVNVKRESVDKKLGLTSLTYGFRGSAENNAPLETLAKYISSVEIVTGEEREALDQPKAKWTQRWD
ncbi:MAG TPA: hypothetical protein VM890_03055 [Longimicrobium sp.]|nr:hypothetical protein [Longimicrobium sp.]